MAKTNKLLDKICKGFLFIVLVAILYSLVRVLLSKINLNTENMENKAGDKIKNKIKDFVLNTKNASPPPAPKPAPEPDPEPDPEPAPEPAPKLSIAQCATNYGTGGNVDMRYQCLNSAPICTGYVAGSNWGTCVAEPDPEPAPKPAPKPTPKPTPEPTPEPAPNHL